MTWLCALAHTLKLELASETSSSIVGFGHLVEQKAKPKEHEKGVVLTSCRRRSVKRWQNVSPTQLAGGADKKDTGSWSAHSETWIRRRFITSPRRCPKSPSRRSCPICLQMSLPWSPSRKCSRRLTPRTVSLKNRALPFSKCFQRLMKNSLNQQ